MRHHLNLAVCQSKTAIKFKIHLNIGVARIFDWRGPNYKSYAMTWSEIFKKEIFYGAKYRKMEDQKPLLGLALQQDLVKGNGLNL